MPAARAAAMPRGESSTTKQAAGGTDNSLAAAKNKSGAGFGRAASSRHRATSSQRASPYISITAFMRLREPEVASASEMPATRSSSNNASSPGESNVSS